MIFASQSIISFFIGIILILMMKMYGFYSWRLPSFIVKGYGNKIWRRVEFGRPFHQNKLFSTGTSTGISVADTRIPKKFNPFPFKYHEIIDVKVEDLSNLGYGIAKVKIYDRLQPESAVGASSTNKEGWVVMVPKVIPGEVARVRIYANRKGYSEADLVEVVTPSPHRITPPCRYFNSCDGCQYQHIPIDMQRNWKRSHVETVLRRIGKIDNPQVNQVIGTNDHHYGYRSKITPHFDLPFTLKKNDSTSSRNASDIKIGFHKAGTRTTMDIEQCIIATSNINDKYLEERTEIKDDYLSNRLEYKNGATLLFREGNDGKVTAGYKGIIEQTVNNITFHYHVNEFFQTNPYALPLLVNHVVKQAVSSNTSILGGKKLLYLVDTYCGSGLFGLCASSHFAHVYGIEIAKKAIDAAKENAKRNNIHNVTFYENKSDFIFNKISSLPPDETVVVIDPPRAGCDETFLSQLCQFSPQRIVYVSCDPATQARDTKYLLEIGNYEIVDITPFDLFPQTRHIENVITYQKRR
jgi:tRNA/tmRNA/rRNA uracil-C5-methylase (TrmA/RlmC/RlmD family)